MRSACRFLGVATLIALIGAGVALAQEPDGVAVGGSNTTRAFSPALIVTVAPLPQFRRTGFDGNSGSWEGPICDFAANPGLSGPISISWGVAFDNEARSAEQAARNSFTFDWATVETGPIAVPHLVGGREVGTIPGFFVLTDSGGQTGYHESGVGFSLGRGVYAASEFWSRGNALECTVHGVPVARWHRDAARAAVRQVGLVGNLPPARVSARARAGRVSGSVTDSYGHPDVGIAVRLEQRTGTRWRSMRSGRTGTAGAYALRTHGSGTYRVVATLAAVSARSAPVRGR